jgi:ABC-2 type transport system permease protein
VLDYLGIERPEPVKILPRVLYNQEQKSALFFVPGLMAVILMMISALLTSLTITREKENRTLQQLLTSPLRPREIILGKILPYIFLAAADGAIILIVGRVNFGIAVQGSMLFLAFCCFVYIFTALSLGLIVSTVARNQQQAMLIVLPATLLPTMILSGFIFPISSMPFALQCISKIIPATFFLEIIRGIILKGVGLRELFPPLGFLLLLGAAYFAIAVKKFGARL